MKVRSGSKLRISSTATSDTVEVDPSRKSAAKQEGEIGVTDRGDQKIYPICKKLCSNRSGHGRSFSF